LFLTVARNRAAESGGDGEWCGCGELWRIDACERGGSAASVENAYTFAGWGAACRSRERSDGGIKLWSILTFGALWRGEDDRIDVFGVFFVDNGFTFARRDEIGGKSWRDVRIMMKIAIELRLYCILF